MIGKMNKRCFFLAVMLAISGVLMGIVGLVVKFAVLAPLELHQDRSAVSLPFILMRDEGLQYMLSHPATEPHQVMTEPSVPPESVPETQPVPTLPEETYPDILETEPDALKHVLFIGDSRTCSLRDHARIDGADYFCDVGMSVFNIGKKKLSDENFHDLSLKKLLARQEYTCVTINLGLNEAGYPVESLMTAYRELLTDVVRTQPQALIVLQGILTVGRNWAQSTPYANPDNLADINRRIEELADGYRIFYIDANDAFADAQGYLPDSMTWDGCHLYARDTGLWSQWFCDSVTKIKR